MKTMLNPLSPARRSCSTWVAVALLSVMAGTANAHGPDPDPRPRPIAPGEGAPGALTGAIEVTNERERPVEVYVDGRFAIEVRGRATQLIEGVPNGIRVVSYTGLGRDAASRWTTDRVEVRIDRRSSLRIAPLRGSVAVRNLSGVAMRVRIGDLDLGIVTPGAEVLSPALPAGRYALVAAPVGMPRAKPQTQEVFVEAGEVARAELRAFAASLVVENPFRRPVQVFIDGAKVGRVERNSRERIDRLDPGLVRIELRGEGRILATDTIELFPGREVQWAPQVARFGAVEFYNPTREWVRVTVGSEGFRLGPAQTRVVTNLPTGVVQVQLTTDDGRIVMHEATIMAGETQRFEIPRAWVTAPGDRPTVRPYPR
ncbi:MAG: hypothetical protein JNJ59_16165 [Deltaproteobacteria bacterium]|nr:hypothetical protein [Deltaproteobacteria bacterium]